MRTATRAPERLSNNEPLPGYPERELPQPLMHPLSWCFVASNQIFGVGHVAGVALRIVVLMLLMDADILSAKSNAHFFGPRNPRLGGLVTERRPPRALGCIFVDASCARFYCPLVASIDTLFYSFLLW